MQTETNQPSAAVAEDVARHHLDQILTSDSFNASPRCQQFLRFVVSETLEGRSDSIKERTIAMEVFGKDQHFEPGEDSLVRVKAREVRKRLAEFYEQHPKSHLRIELPLGGYVPRFRQQDSVSVEASSEAELDSENTSQPQPFSRRKLILGGSAVALAASVWGVSRYVLSPHTPLDKLWQPIFSTNDPLLISIPLLNAEDGSVTERVGLGAATAANETAEFLGSRRYPYRLRFGSDFTFSQLREQPSLLLGGFSSEWTGRITNPLRFSLVQNASHDGGAVYDKQTGKTYGPIYVHNGYAPADYALVCRLFDEAAGQVILVAAGITTFGTESAARFLLRPNLFDQIISGQGGAWEKKNFQALIHISIIGTTPSAPTVVNVHFW